MVTSRPEWQVLHERASPIAQTTPFRILGDPRVLVHRESVTGADMSPPLTIHDCRPAPPSPAAWPWPCCVRRYNSRSDGGPVGPVVRCALPRNTRRLGPPGGAVQVSFVTPDETTGCGPDATPIGTDGGGCASMVLERPDSVVGDPDHVPELSVSIAPGQLPTTGAGKIGADKHRGPEVRTGIRSTARCESA